MSVSAVASTLASPTGGVCLLSSSAACSYSGAKCLQWPHLWVVSGYCGRLGLEDRSLRYSALCHIPLLWRIRFVRPKRIEKEGVAEGGVCSVEHKGEREHFFNGNTFLLFWQINEEAGLGRGVRVLASLEPKPTSSSWATTIKFQWAIYGETQQPILWAVIVMIRPRKRVHLTMHHKKI